MHSQQTKQDIRVVLAGGGTMGSVSPLLAVLEALERTARVNAILVGTTHGPERAVAENQNIPFVSIHGAKLRRYWSLRNLVAPFELIAGFVQAWQVLSRFKPDCVFGAGGFVQVPIMYAAWVRGIPVVIHQQDVQPTLSNTLCAPVATKITVSLEHSLRSFSQGTGLFRSKISKVEWTGNPVRGFLSRAMHKEAVAFFNLEKDFPTVFITGGGTGAAGLNALVVASLPALLKVAQVIHTTGKHKTIEYHDPRYHAFEFIERMDLAYAAADIVVSRAGLSAITELSVLGKISIIIPMPDTHQEANAELLWQRGAALTLDQNDVSPQEFVEYIRQLLHDHGLQQQLSKNIAEIMPKNGADKIANLITELV